MSIDWTKPVQTRDGRKVTIYTTTAPTEHPVHGYVEGWGGPTFWTSGGLFLGDAESDEDLINVPEAPEPKRVVWLNMYLDGVGGPYPTKAAAQKWALEHRVACVRVEWTPGQFDEEPQP